MNLWFLVGLYVLGVMFFCGIMIMWLVFDWLCKPSAGFTYNLVAFFVSVIVFCAYEYVALLLLDWIADKLDV